VNISMVIQLTRIILLAGVLLTLGFSHASVHSHKRKLSKKGKRHDWKHEDNIGIHSPQEEIYPWQAQDYTHSNNIESEVYPMLKHGKYAKHHHHSQHKQETQSEYQHEDHNTDKDDPCGNLVCSGRKEVCIYDASTKAAECIHRRVLRIRKKLQRVGFSSNNISRITGGSRHHLYSSSKSPQEIYAYKKKSGKDGHLTENQVIQDEKDSTHTECSVEKLHEMGRRLLDWFKLLQDDAEKEQTHNAGKVKRNSHKKELREKGICECQGPVSWQFTELDVNTDEGLQAEELGDIEANLYESCVTPFLASCDTDSDTIISHNEWCCCFQQIYPPCVQAQRKILGTERAHPVSMPGIFIPTCDRDGFFQHMQCQAGLAQCWCVDRNGNEIKNTRVLGAADCAKYSGRYTGRSPTKDRLTH